jgi:hypothetical protein
MTLSLTTRLRRILADISYADRRSLELRTGLDLDSSRLRQHRTDVAELEAIRTR